MHLVSYTVTSPNPIIPRVKPKEIEKMKDFFLSELCRRDLRCTIQLLLLLQCNHSGQTYVYSCALSIRFSAGEPVNLFFN